MSTDGYSYSGKNNCSICYEFFDTLKDIVDHAIEKHGCIRTDDMTPQAFLDSIKAICKYHPLYDQGTIGSSEHYIKHCKRINCRFTFAASKTIVNKTLYGLVHSHFVHFVNMKCPKCSLILSYDLMGFHKRANCNDTRGALEKKRNGL